MLLLMNGEPIELIFKVLQMGVQEHLSSLVLSDFPIKLTLETGTEYTVSRPCGSAVPKH